MNRLGGWRRSQRHGGVTAHVAGPRSFWSMILIMLACLMMLGLQFWNEWTARTSQVRETEASLVNLASSLAQHAEDTIEVADTALVGVVERLETDGTSPGAMAQLDRELRAQVAAAPRYSAIIILGADGNWLATSLPAKGRNASDRSFYLHHRDDPDPGLFVGSPIQSRMTGKWVLTLSRRFQSADGSFGGLVLGLIDLSYFASHYAKYDLGPNSTILLMATDGTLLVRYPSNEVSFGRNLSTSALFSQLLRHPAGSYENVAKFDGTRRFTGYRQSDRYPLVVAAGMSADYALESWRADSHRDMAIAVVLIAAVGLLGMHLIRLARRSQAAEDRVRESEERYRSQAQNLREANERTTLATDSGGIGIWDWNVTDNKMTWDPWMYRLHGIQQLDETLTFATWLQHLHPDDGAAAEQTVRDCLEGSKPYNNEFRVIWDDGSIHHIRSSGRVTRDAAGVVTRIVGVNWDVTNERIEEEQRAIIIEAAPNGMMIIDEAGVITLVNSQVGQIFGYPDGTLVGQPVETLVSDVAGSKPHSAFASGPDDQAMAPQRQFIGRKRDGSEVTIEIMLSPVKTPLGRIIVASLFDVSDRVRQAAEQHAVETSERLAAAATNERLDRLSRHLGKARDRAEQANQAKSRFLAGMTHELRTPLHGILGYAEMLILEGSLNPVQSGRLEVMIASGQHLLGMINSVLDMSQIEADRLELLPADIELPGLISGCLDVVRPAAEAKGLLLVQAPAPPLRLFADPTRLRQVLINLLGNAVKFTATGRIEVRLCQTKAEAAQAEAWVRLEVADTGPGIRDEHRDKLFQTFERLNAEAVSGIEGAGLGLSLAARLVQLMGGRIGYAENPTGGSVFWVELPAPDAAPAVNIANVAPTQLTRGPPLRVLVADDEALNRSIATGFLSIAGHEVVCVENGAAAVEAAETGDFDVILMDVRMPGMNGLEATRLIRALPFPRGEVPIVAVTAQVFAEQIELCRQAGMDSHVAKPFKQAVLLAALENVRTARRGKAVATKPSSSGDTSDEPPLPVFDRNMFDDITDSLAAADVEEYIRTLIVRCEALLHALRSHETPAVELVEEAHKLAGGAGTFGFLAVAAAARQFEVAADTGDAKTEVFADQLAVTIEVAIVIIRQELAATAAIAS